MSRTYSTEAPCRVLFVCLGNICRSPTAEGVFRKVVQSQELDAFFHIDSAGTANWHEGNTPDSRAQQAAKRRGFDISSLRGRQIGDQDFDQFDYVIGMDHSNREDLLAIAGPSRQHKVHLLLSFSGQTDAEVPDPYYGGEQGFNQVIDQIEQASIDLLSEIQRHILR